MRNVWCRHGNLNSVRIYTNNRLLNLGYYHFENENDEEAQRIWNAALNLKPKVGGSCQR